MAEQLDMRAVLSLVRRRSLLVVAIALVGATLGVALVTWHPPLYTSTSKVLLPPRPPEADGARTAVEASTQVSIAESDAVLGPAASAVSPPLTKREVRKLVEVTAPTEDVLFIDAKGESGAAASALAQAVAEAEVAYQAGAASLLSAADLAALRDRRAALQGNLDAVNAQIVATQERLDATPAGSTPDQGDAKALTQLTAQQTDLVLEIDELDTRIGSAVPSTSARIIEDATAAERPMLLVWYVAAGLGAGLLAALLAVIVLVARARRDAKLTTRDEIADAVGSEVIASLRSQDPRTVAAWRSLLGDYSPSVAEGWSVRLALAGLGLEHLAMGHADGSEAARSGVRKQLCVLSLEDDVRALSMGPQIASYAASLGISTRLVPEQQEATAALWAACSSTSGEPLRDHLTVSSRRRTKQVHDLTVVVAVLDRREPRMPRLGRADSVVLAVSSRAFTAEDLARAAVIAYEAGFRIAGVLVSDPDTLDRTTGRLLPHERLQQAPLPSRGGGLRSVASRDGSWSGGAS